MMIDLHCHYTLTARRATADFERFSFEPAEHSDGRPAWDSYVAPRMVRQLKWRILRWMMGLPTHLPPGDELDNRLEAFYERHLFAPGPIDRFVLLAYDEYHDAAGRIPPPPLTARQHGSDIYTSNSLVRELCRRHPERFLFGASIHPYRTDAPRLVEEVFAAGACLLKWIPLNQNIDVRDERTLAVLRACARLGLPLLAHYCDEFTLATPHPEFADVRTFLAALRTLRDEGAMPPVIVAHVATPLHGWRPRAALEAFVEALRGEFRDAPLYADISALTALSKLRFLDRFAREADLHGKLLFGSDFPVPLGGALLRRRLSRGARKEMRAQPSWPQQAALAFRDVGYQEIVFRRAADVLPLRS